MEISEAQIIEIQSHLEQHGVTDQSLLESLIDHICCQIESSSLPFSEAKTEALEAFGPNGIEEIQKETHYLLTIEPTIAMKKFMYTFGFIAVFLSTTGLLFRLQQWSGAGIILTLGIALLNFGFLPMFFYDRYKTSIQ